MTCRPIWTRRLRWAEKCWCLRCQFQRELLRGCRIRKEIRLDCGSRHKNKSGGGNFMRRTGILIALTCVFAMAAISLNARRDDRRQAMQAPQPGPEMQRLNFLIGSWDTVSEYEKSPMMPNGGKQNGWYKAQLGPGGFSVIADLEEDSPLGKDLGHEIISDRKS